MTLSAALVTPWTDFAGILSSSPQKKNCLEYLRYSFRTLKKILSNKINNERVLLKLYGYNLIKYYNTSTRYEVNGKIFNVFCGCTSFHK